LGLASGVVVRLKQVRSNMLLDLDDGMFSCVQVTRWNFISVMVDDDFEALRAQALDDTLSTIDIKVTVEERNSQVCPMRMRRSWYPTYTWFGLSSHLLPRLMTNLNLPLFLQHTRHPQPRSGG